MIYTPRRRRGSSCPRSSPSYQNMIFLNPLSFTTMVRSVAYLLLLRMSSYSWTVVDARSTTPSSTTTSPPSFKKPYISFVRRSRRGGHNIDLTPSSRHMERRIPTNGVCETNHHNHHHHYCLDGPPSQSIVPAVTAIPRGGQRVGYGGDGDDDDDYYYYRNDINSRFPSTTYPDNDDDDVYSYRSSTKGLDRTGRYDDYDDAGYYDDRGISSSRRDGSDSGTTTTSRATPTSSSSSFADRLPAIIRTGNRQVGLPLLGIGAALTVLGMSLFFNKTLMRLGNIFFVAGVPMTLGPGRTAGYFFQPKKARATACLALGLFLVFVGWPIVGILLEAFGLLNLFGNMFPVAMVILKQMPVIGPLLKGDFGGGNRNGNNNSSSNSRDDSRRRGSSYDDYYDDRYSDPDDRGWDRHYDEPNYFHGDDDNLQGYY